MMLSDWIPLLRDLRLYRREWLSRDVIAGLSVAAVQVPTAIAYANLAGFPPEVGLYASMLPVLVYASGGWDAHGRYFHALFQFQLMGLNGAFVTGDLFNLFVFFEIMLAASYGLLLHG